MLRVLFLLQSAFSLWMLVDAIRRGSERYWFLIIMLPFGEWAYFFRVKIHDPEFSWLKDSYRRLTTKKLSIDDLRYRLQTTPSFNNRVILAQALFDAGRYDEALPLFAEAVEMDAHSCEARYGLARCYVEKQQWPPAIEQLRAALNHDTGARQHALYSDLAHALCQDGRLDEALKILKGWAGKSPRLDRCLVYAHYLVLSENPEEARQQLELGLLDHEHAPKFLKKLHRPWFKQANKMLQELTLGASTPR